MTHQVPRPRPTVTRPHPRKRATGHPAGPVPTEREAGRLRPAMQDGRRRSLATVAAHRGEGPIRRTLFREYTGSDPATKRQAALTADNARPVEYLINTGHSIGIPVTLINQKTTRDTALTWRDNPRKTAPRSTAFGDLPTRERPSGSAAASAGRRDIPPGPTTPTRTRHATASREACQFQRAAKSKGRETTPCHSQRIAHQGACGKTRVVAQNRRPRTTTGGNGSTTCVCCRRMGEAVTSNQWRDRQCGRKRSGRHGRRWHGGTRRPTGRSGRPTRQRAGSQRRGHARQEVR